MGKGEFRNDISSSSHLPFSHSALLPLFYLPPGKWHSLGMSPQILERVVGTRLLIEHMDHYRAVIEQNPSAFVITLDPHPLVAQLALEYPVDLFTDGVQLAAAVTGSEHEVVELRGHAPHIQYGHIATAVILGSPGGGQRELLAACLTGFDRSTYFSDG